MPVTVCAIIINYFGTKNTERCICSLSSEPLTTLMLIDNSGTEEERASMAILVAKTRLTGAPFRIQSINNSENLGFGIAINRAITQDLLSTGGHDYYLLMNNDAEATPGLITGLLQAAKDDPKLALVAPRIHWGATDVCYYTYQPLLGHVSRKPFPGSFNYLSGCCLLVDKVLAPEGKLFDERFFMYGEDIDLTARAIRVGRKIACIENLTVKHEGSGSAQNGSFFYEYSVARGHVLLAATLSKTFATLLLFVIGRAFYLMLRAIIRCNRSHSWIPLRAYLLAWTPYQAKPSRK